MRLELAKLHKELKSTMLYFTHGQVEAMTLATKIVVLNGGNIAQVGTPLELYHTPANKFVCSFIGSPAMNFLDPEVVSTSPKYITITIDSNRRMRLICHTASITRAEHIEIGIRPEHISISTTDDKLADPQGAINSIEQLGNSTVLYVDSNVGQIIVECDGEPKANIGDTVGLHFDHKKIHAFAASGEIISHQAVS